MGPVISCLDSPRIGSHLEGSSWVANHNGRENQARERLRKDREVKNKNSVAAIA